jgi:hypothetical protein
MDIMLRSTTPTTRSLIVTRRCTMFTRSTIRVMPSDRIIMKTRMRLRIILDSMVKMDTAKVNNTQTENRPKKMMTSIPDLRTQSKKPIDLNVGQKNSPDN